MFSSGGTESAPFAANCIMFDGSLEARIKSIVRDISSPSRTATTRFHRAGFAIPHRQFQLSNQSIRLPPKKFLQQSPIIPKRSVAPAIETGPDRFSNFPESERMDRTLWSLS